MSSAYIFNRFFDELLVSLDDETEFVNKIRGIGSAHAILAKGSNFSSDIWERLGEIAMERVCSHEVVTVRSYNSSKQCS